MRHLASLLVAVVVLFPQSVSAQWQSLNGPQGGAVYTLASYGGNLFAGTAGSIFRSTDGGSSWELRQGELGPGGVSSFTEHAGSIFAGNSGQRLLRSSDGGSTWSEVASGNGSVVKDMLSKGNALYTASLWRGIWRTTDLGQTWEERNSGLPETRSNVFIAVGPAFVVGLPGGGLYRSTDDGVNWTDISSSVPAGEARLACVHQGDAFVFFAGSGILRSTDDGVTWNPTTATGNYYALYSDGSRLYATTSQDLLFSDDAGTSWTTRSLKSQSGRGVSILKTAGGLFVAHLVQGVTVSTDEGQNWEVRSNGLYATKVQSIYSKGTAYFAAVQDAGLFQSTNGGGSWAPLQVDPNVRDVRDMVEHGNMLLCGSEDAIHYSTDGGTTWSISTGSAYSISCLSRGGSGLFAGTFQGEVLASTDGGLNWVLRGDLGTGDDINAIIDNGTVLMASTQGDGTFVSTDGGASWEQRNNGIEGSLTSESLAYKNGVWYRGKSPGLYRSWNDGANWFVQRNSVRSSSVYRMHPVDGGLVCGTYNHGVYFYDTRDSVWTKISDGYQGSAVFALHEDQGNVLLGSYANGAWIRSVSDLRPSPEIAFDPQGVDFGTVDLGGNRTERVAIENVGEGTVRLRSYAVEGTDAAAFSLTLAGDDVLHAGASTAIDIQFSPTEARTYSAELVVTSNDIKAETRRVPLSGSGLQAPVIRVVPASYDYGDVETGKEKEMTFAVHNDGNATLEVQLPVIEGADATSFTHSGTALSIPPSELRNVSAKFVPVSEGQKNAALVLVSNDPSQPRLEITLTGTGIRPAQPDIYVDRPSINFPTTDVGNMRAERLRIENRGGMDLEISSTSVTGNGSAAFTVVDGGSMTIAPGNQHELTVEFRPAAIQPYGATLVIQSNDPDIPTFRVLLSGRGTGDPSPEIELDRTSVSYGSVPVGGTRNESVVISNIGNEPLIITGFRLQGLGSDQFIFVQADTATLERNQKLTAIIAFAPSKSGLHRADLIIMSNDPITPNVLLTLTGDAIVSSSDRPPLPPATVLMQNHPNPAAQLTLFPFQLKERGHVRIEILDLLGRSVHTLRDAVLNPGMHRVQLDVSSFRTGVYLCRMTTGRTVSTRRFIVRR